MTRDSFIFYHDWREALQRYPTATRREVYEAIVEYSVTGTVPQMSLRAADAFAFIKPSMDRNSLKYKEKVEARTAAARARWNKEKMQKDAKNANADFAMLNDNVNDNVNDNGSVNVNDNENKSAKADTILTATDVAATVPPYREITSLWNEILGSKLPKVAKLSEIRKNHLRARLAEWGRTREAQTDTARAIFTRMAASDFLCGASERGWRADFDWIIKSPNNWAKVTEGNYDNRETARPASPSRPDRTPGGVLRSNVDALAALDDLIRNSKKQLQ